MSEHERLSLSEAKRNSSVAPALQALEAASTARNAACYTALRQGLEINGLGGNNRAD